MMDKREKRDAKKFLITLIIGVLPEIAFAWIIGKILDVATWKVWLFVQAITLLSSGIKETLGYFVYKFIWRKDIVNNLTESLSALEYPNPKKYPYNTLADEYFGSVMTDDDIEINTRLDAAYALGTASSIFSQKGFFDSMRMQSTLSDAINRYHRIKFDGKEYID